MENFEVITDAKTGEQTIRYFTDEENAERERNAPVPASITFAQLLIGLVSEGWISEADGDAWLAGVLPAQVLALISTLPRDQQFAAKARASRPSEVLRADPLVVALGYANGKSPDDMNVFFRKYAAA